VVRTTLGAEVDTTVTVSGSESVELVDLTQSGSVSSGNAEVVSLTAPTGFVFEVLSVTLIVRGISGAGGINQKLSIRAGGGKLVIAGATSSPTSPVRYNQSYWIQADVEANPASPGDQTAAVRGTRADDSIGINIRYKNNTDSNQTADREYKLLVRRIQVGKV